MPITLTQDQIDQIHDHVRQNTQLADSGCPSCGRRLEVMNTPVYYPMIPDEGEPSPAPGLPAALLVCSNCATAVPIMLGEIGIEPGEEAEL